MAENGSSAEESVVDELFLDKCCWWIWIKWSVSLLEEDDNLGREGVDGLEEDRHVPIEF